MFDKIKELQINKESVILYIFMLAYKFIMEFAYVRILHANIDTFPLHISLWKYALGMLMITLMFAVIGHAGRKVSAFLMELMLFIGMVPVTVYYALCNESTLYYMFLSLSFILCGLILKIKLPQKMKAESRKIKIHGMSEIVPLVCLVLIAGVTALVVATSGLPSLKALNLSDVYSLRSENYFIKNIYLATIYSWMMVTAIPFMLAYCLTKRKYIFSVCFIALVFVFFLYSGNKTTLFSIPLILLTYIFMRLRSGRGNFRLWEWFTAGIGGAVALCLTTYPSSPIFSLIGRRALMIPAQLKFYYYDFFLSNPKLGFTGVFPGGLGGVKPYGEDDSIGTIISLFYWEKNQNANTGFMAEGFERFGYPGIIISFVIIAIILLLIDRLQKRTNYLFAACVSVYPIYYLNDGSLIRSVVTGPLLILILICVFYYNDEMKKESYDHGIKIHAR